MIHLFRSFQFVFIKKSNAFKVSQFKPIMDVELWEKNNKVNASNYLFNESESLDTQMLYKIQQNFHKKSILKYLQNENISIHSKIDMIKNNNIFSNSSIYTYNITAGGLYKDW